MKFQITMKTPNVLDHALGRAREELLHSDDEEDDMPIVDHISEEKREEIFSMYDEMKSTAEKWIRHGEYVTLEFDTESGGCTVVPVRK